MYIKSAKELDVYKLAYEQAIERNHRIGQMLGIMINKAETFCKK